LIFNDFSPSQNHNAAQAAQQLECMAEAVPDGEYQVPQADIPLKRPNSV
jgi:hypothetical protein